jgi:hypothetical protein
MSTNDETIHANTVLLTNKFLDYSRKEVLDLYQVENVNTADIDQSMEMAGVIINAFASAMVHMLRHNFELSADEAIKQCNEMFQPEHFGSAPHMH